MNKMTRNLGDISKSIRPTMKIGDTWFIREKFIRFMESKFADWEKYCIDNNILIVEEVRTEIDKFMELIKVESEITKKMFKSRLVFGKDIDLKVTADRWLDEYL